MPIQKASAMFAFFRKRKKVADLPARAISRAAYDMVTRHQIECGPFNSVRTLSGQH